MEKSRSLPVEGRERDRNFETIARDGRCSIRIIAQCVSLPSNSWEKIANGELVSI